MAAKLGEIRCGKTERGVNHPTLSGFFKINASSTGPQEWKGLSPMLLGPFKLIEPSTFETYFPEGVHPGFTKIDDKTQSTIIKKFENYWQGSKVYKLDLIANSETGSSTVDPKFFARRAEMFASEKGKRRSLPKAKSRASHFRVLSRPISGLCRIQKKYLLSILREISSCHTRI